MVAICSTTRHYSPEDCACGSHSHDNLKSNNLTVAFSKTLELQVMERNE
jgi:hypothetical protein